MCMLQYIMSPYWMFQIISYAQACLVYGAGLLPDLSTERDLRDESPHLVAHMQQLIGSDTDRAVLNQYIEMCRQLLAVHSGEYRG